MELVSGVQFFTNLHNKTGHFFAFFSISPLFVQKVRHFVKKSTFFCHGQRPNPHFQPKNKPPKNSRYTKTQLYTQKYIFLVKLFSPFTLFSSVFAQMYLYFPNAKAPPSKTGLKLVIKRLYVLFIFPLTAVQHKR